MSFDYIPATTAAADRNKGPILEVLKNYLGQNQQLVLEIASGTGQQVAHFAPHFPNVTFLPTDIDANLLKSTEAHREQSGCPNILKPVYVDVAEPFSKWTVPEILKPGAVDLIFCSNLIHVSSNAAVDGLFKAAGELLVKGGVLVTYGAYSVDGVISPQSNIDFDKKIRANNPEWGLRDTTFLRELAAHNGLTYEKMYDMPANNKILVFRHQ